MYYNSNRNMMKIKRKNSVSAQIAYVRNRQSL